MTVDKTEQGLLSKQRLVLLLMRNVADGMMLIGKLVRGLSLLFPGSGLTKESDAAAPLPAKLIQCSGRSTALPYPPYEQSN